MYKNTSYNFTKRNIKRLFLIIIIENREKSEIHKKGFNMDFFTFELILEKYAQA